MEKGIVITIALFILVILVACNRKARESGEGNLSSSSAIDLSAIGHEKYGAHTILLNRDSSYAAIVDQLKFNPRQANKNFRFVICGKKILRHSFGRSCRLRKDVLVWHPRSYCGKASW